MQAVWRFGSRFLQRRFRSDHILAGAASLLLVGQLVSVWFYRDGDPIYGVRLGANALMGTLGASRFGIVGATYAGLGAAILAATLLTDPKSFAGVLGIVLSASTTWVIIAVVGVNTGDNAVGMEIVSESWRSGPVLAYVAAFLLLLIAARPGDVDSAATEEADRAETESPQEAPESA